MIDLISNMFIRLVKITMLRFLFQSSHKLIHTLCRFLCHQTKSMPFEWCVYSRPEVVVKLFHSYVVHRLISIRFASRGKCEIYILHFIPPQCNNNALFCAAFSIPLPTTNNSKALRHFCHLTPTVVGSPSQSNVGIPPKSVVINCAILNHRVYSQSSSPM